MIGKHMKGRGFSHALRYVLTKPGAQLLGGTLSALDPEDANLEFQTVAKASSRTQKPLLHCVLSLAPGESLSNHQWRMLSEQYLRSLAYVQNQYLLVRHTDTPSHEHVHILLNRVGLDGKAVSDSWDYLRSQTIIHELEAQYGLSHAPLGWQKKQGQNKEAVFRYLFSEPAIESLPPSAQAQVRWQRQLRQHVNGALITSGNLPSFTQQLTEQGIALKLLHRRQTAAGVSFEWRGQRIAGSRLGQAYSLPKLLTVMEGIAAPFGSVNLGSAPSSDLSDSTDLESEAEAEQLEPDEALPAAHQQYLQLEALAQQQAQIQLTRQQIDQQIASWVLRSAQPSLARSMVYSPVVQQLRRQQGDAAAMDYLRQLMEKAQQQLKEIDREGPARMEQKRNERKEQRER